MIIPSDDEMKPARFESLLDLIPGSALDERTLNEVLVHCFDIVYRLDAESKASFLQDCVYLLMFVQNENSEKKAKVKRPKPELVSWLNLFGPLIIIKQRKTLALPTVPDIECLSISFAGDGIEEEVYSLPRHDVFFIIPNN
jgi:hypothetical protein